MYTNCRTFIAKSDYLSTHSIVPKHPNCFFYKTHCYLFKGIFKKSLMDFLDLMLISTRESLQMKIRIKNMQCLTIKFPPCQQV